METPVKGYFRLFPGNEVRLKTTYVVKCTGCKKDENGNVVEVYAEYDPESRGGNPADGRKIKSTIHWVDAKNAEDAEIRLYDNLFTVEDPDAGDFLELLNPDSPSRSSRAARWKRASKPQSRARASSSCVRAISAWITRIPQKTTLSSTAPFR